MKHFTQRWAPDLRLLYYFELKKLISRKMVWLTIGIMLLLILAANVSSLFIKTASVDMDGNVTYQTRYEEAMKVKVAAQAISGREVDDSLLNEMKRAYEDVRIIFYEETEEKEMTSESVAVRSEEDRRSAEEIEKDHRTYKEIYHYAINYVGYQDVLNIDEEKLYQVRQNTISEESLYWELDEAELHYWSEQEDKVEKPFSYEYKEGASLFFARINLLSYLLIALTAICLSGFFGEEHVRRTDQIILCSRHGKLPVYLARMAAGITFSMGGTLLFYLTQLLVILAVYGTGGFRVALQLYLWRSSWAVSIGEAIVILFFVSLAAAVLCSVITMLLSELFRNGVATLATMLAVTLFTMLEQVPVRYGLVSQIYALAPVRLLNETVFLDKRLFHAFGRYFTGLQMAPVFYLITAVFLIGIGYRVYERYQVSGR